MNRSVGKITEEQFEHLMGGHKKTFKFGGETRHVDNLFEGTAREIKSGKLTKTDFIENQLRKDIMMLRTDGVPVHKIEWHLFDGIDPDIKKVLETLRNTYGKDKFDFIVY